jgi:hypothetical protein
MANNLNSDDFSVDPRNKLGAEVDWEGEDFASFVDALTSGSAVRSVGVARVADASGEIELTADDLHRIKSLLANYR